MIGIYKILCTVTNEFYIGSSINIASRKAGHLYNLRNNKHTNPILQAKYNKYGESNFIFSLLETCSKSKLLVLEQYYLDTLKPLLNCNKVAGRPPRIAWTKEAKKKMSLAKRGVPHKNKRIYTKEGLARVQSRNKQLFLQGSLGGIGSNHPGSSLKEFQVIQIKELIEENILELKQIADLFNVTYSCISDIKYNRSWTHLRATIKTNGRKKSRSLTYQERLDISKVYKTYFLK